MHPLTHNYGTRIRNNSLLKPGPRLRQSPPPPRKIKPVPAPAPAPARDPSLPLFPLPGVMLHPEDASNKVFHAIGRSFLSVENRAMTIKDLAEMTLKYGLMCQNVSAASQAITTYIRNHMARCEAQQDHPLLLRHVLSGTPADDDLVPALYSRVGGATSPAKSSSKDSIANANNLSQSTLEVERLTNFRRGTIVWYLSKAAGVSCPFARAGIRLCDYGKEGKKAVEKYRNELQLAPKKRADDDGARCGEKRKRLRRGCRRDTDLSQESSSGDRDSESPANDSADGELSADASGDERPPKVKLTLRLRPSLPTPVAPSQPREVIDLSNETTGTSSEDENISADDSDAAVIHTDPAEVPWSLPPYPRRSVSVPHYTPICDERIDSTSLPAQLMEERRRSPSVPWSATPPPDSDHDDFDFDSDVDWDSSSLSVPSPASDPQVRVETTDDLQPFKRESADIRDILDAWEDLDCAPTSTVSSATVKLPVTEDLKFDALELWEWEFESSWTGAQGQQDFPVVKMESDEHECLAPFPTFTPALPISPSSSLVSSSLSPSSPVCELGSTSYSRTSSFAPCASPMSSFSTGNDGCCVLAWQDVELLGPDSVHPQEFEEGWATGVRAHANCNILPRRASSEAPAPLSVEPEESVMAVACKETDTCHTELRVRPSPSSIVVGSDVVVVHTCRPCTPDVCATQIEGISVYQTTLGSALLLRRIDTDFVNLSTILTHLSLSRPSFLPNACVNVLHPSSSIDGIWAPLSVARSYAHSLPKGIESVFLSDDLVMRFPTALQDFYEKSTSGRLLNQFGPHFNASLSSTSVVNPHMPQLDQGKSTKENDWGVSMEGGLGEEPLLAIPPSVNRALAALHSLTSVEEATYFQEMPLSPTEQEIFRALCVHPDWETEEAGKEGKDDTATKHNFSGERPLRRSRRVADAVAARSRVASPRTKGPRHS